jgi:putative DNA primase/helicase
MARSSIPPGAVGAPLWWPNLTLNDKDGPRAIVLNGDVALSQDPAFTGAIRFDRFRNQTMVCAPLPWDPHTQIPRPWENKDDYEACLWLQHEGIMLNDDKVNTMVEGIAQRYPYHPVMDYLHSVT